VCLGIESVSRLATLARAAGRNWVTLCIMRVLGIDCGTEFTGFGVAEQSQSGDRTIRYITCGAIRLSKRDLLPVRLVHIYESLRALVETHKPDIVAIEEVFYSVNAKSALKLGQVRGVAMLAASSCGLQVAEYAPLAIKSAVVGYGRADKQQVQYMVMQLLKLNQIPEPSDAADALAIAICHLHTSATIVRQKAATSK
jgi:crossover junction endodeoxyribonuclease RuvC